jgi:hypothetical protein
MTDTKQDIAVGQIWNGGLFGGNRMAVVAIEGDTIYVKRADSPKKNLQLGKGGWRVPDAPLGVREHDPSRRAFGTRRRGRGREVSEKRLPNHLPARRRNEYLHGGGIARS